MSETYRGDTTAEQQSELRSDSRTGTAVTRKYFGKRSDIEGLVTTLAIDGIVPWTITPAEGPMAELTVEYPGGSTATEDPIEEEWSYDSTASIAPLTELPAIKAILDAADPADVCQLRERIDKGACEAGWSAALESEAVIDAYVAFADRGVTTYYRPEPTLVYQATYQKTAAYRPTMAVVGAVYTTATLISVFAVPGDLDDGLPTGEWLLELLRYQTSSNGSRVYQLGWRYAVTWGRNPLTGDPFIYAIS